MCAKWITKANFTEIIDSIESSRNKTKAAAKVSREGNSVSFDATRFDEDLASLISYIEFKEEIPECERSAILHNAVFALGRRGAIQAKALLSELCKHENEFLKKKPISYRLVTTLSITRPENCRFISIQGRRIWFYSVLPERFLRSRDKLAVSARRSLLADEPTNYTWVVVAVKARTIREAADLGLATIDLLRSLWNLQINSSKISRRSMGGRAKPVNDILLGPLHSLHFPKGPLAAENYWWYQPAYAGPAKLYSIDKHWAVLEKVRTKALLRLKTSAFSDLVTGCLIRYTTALDDSNLQDAFLRLWALLEALTGTQNASYGDTVRRAAFFYKDREHAQQILNHLRQRRNNAMHQGSQIEDSEIIIYQMKRFCETVLWFLIFHSSSLKSVEEYRQFLDSPCDTEVLANRIEILKQAKKFRQHK